MGFGFLVDPMLVIQLPHERLLVFLTKRRTPLEDD